ncbi:MAG: hypothetical protein QXD64_08760 [Thermoplasmata archaeon]
MNTKKSGWLWWVFVPPLTTTLVTSILIVTAPYTPPPHFFFPPDVRGELVKVNVSEDSTVFEVRFDINNLNEEIENIKLFYAAIFFKNNNTTLELRENVDYVWVDSWKDGIFFTGDHVILYHSSKFENAVLSISVDITYKRPVSDFSNYKTGLRLEGII